MKSIIKEQFNKAIRSIGFELVRYNPRSSLKARIMQYFKDYQIDTVLDVGANIGQYAKFLRNSGYKGRIISFEPLSQAHQKIVINSRKDSKWIIAPRMALGNKDGKKKLNIAANDLSSSILGMTDIHIKGAPDSGYINSEDVYVAKLDSVANNYLENDNIVFLKIDVQGFEFQVIEGAKNTLPYIKGMQIEISIVPLYKGQLLFSDMLNYIASLGFELYDILPGFRDKQTGRLLQFDAIFFRPL